MKKEFICRLLLILVTASVLWHATSAHGQPSQQTAPEWNALGVEYYDAGDWNRALSCFLEAAALVPGNETVQQNLANAYQARAAELADGGDYSSAAQHLEEAIKASPESPLPRVQLGSYFLRMSLVQDAIVRLEEAILLAPENLDAHELLGDAYYQDNDLPSALAQWEFVAKVNPGRAGLRDKLDKGYREDSVEYDFKNLKSRHFTITHDPHTDRGLLRQALTVLEHAYRDIGRNFGNVYPPTPILVNVYIADDFSRATALGPHVAAVYDGKIRLPVSDGTGGQVSAEELRRLLYHEYTHVVVRYLLAENAPWWFNEGLAETFSNELTPRDVELLHLASSNGGLFPLHTLEAMQTELSNEDELRLAYRQSHASVQYLWRRFGAHGLSRMIDALSRGISAEKALLQSYKLNYDQLQKESIASVVQSSG